MDEAVLLGTDLERVPDCDREASVEVYGYWLCAPCALALKLYMDLAVQTFAGLPRG